MKPKIFVGDVTPKNFKPIIGLEILCLWAMIAAGAAASSVLSLGWPNSSLKPKANHQH